MSSGERRVVRSQLWRAGLATNSVVFWTCRRLICQKIGCVGHLVFLFLNRLA